MQEITAALESTSLSTPLPGNYLPEACKGCVIVHTSHPLIIGVAPSQRAAPPYQWDAKSKVFTVCNSSDFPCFTYLTFCEVDVIDKNGNAFESGTTRDEAGRERRAVTFVVVANPCTLVRLGCIDAGGGLLSADFFAIDLERLLAPPEPFCSAVTTEGVVAATVVACAVGASSSSSGEDVVAAGSRALAAGCQEGVSEQPFDSDLRPTYPALGFPLPDSSGPYLCTQGVGGHLTHFFPESYHAIDLRCPVRTPVLSVGDGFVREIAESHRCGGIHAANLASWNSISLRLDCGLVVEYLHTMPGSARVQVGDPVRLGQVLCDSGDIGFAPEPHLHIEAHDANDPDGPSLPLLFAAKNNNAGGEVEGAAVNVFVPIAGRWYASAGEVPAPSVALEAVEDHCAI